MSSIAIFCGSAPGKDSVFVENARKVGETLAAQGKTLIYGGGRSGLMGVVADSTLAAGGRAIGVMPESLAEYELAHPHLTELYIVENMHARKIKMSELAEGFIALPGGRFVQGDGQHHRALGFHAQQQFVGVPRQHGQRQGVRATAQWALGVGLQAA